MGIAARVLAREKIIKSLQFGIRNTSLDGGPLLSTNPEDLIIVDDDNDEVTVKQYVKKRWNGGLNAKATVGENQITLNAVTIVDINGDKHTVTQLTIGLMVEQLYHEGPWIIEEAQGLYNSLKGTFHAYGNMKSATLSIEEMEKTFVELDQKMVDQSKYSIILDIASEYH